MGRFPGVMLLGGKYHDLYHNCSKDGTDFLLEKLRIRDCRDKPCFTAK